MSGNNGRYKIYNIHANGYLFASSTLKVDKDGDDVTWLHGDWYRPVTVEVNGGRDFLENIWRVVEHPKGGYGLYNEYCRQWMITAQKLSKVDDRASIVLQNTDDQTVDRFTWAEGFKIATFSGNTTILNWAGCPVYAAEYRAFYDGKRRRALAWLPKNEVAQGDWRFERVD